MPPRPHCGASASSSLPRRALMLALLALMGGCSALPTLEGRSNSRAFNDTATTQLGRASLPPAHLRAWFERLLGDIRANRAGMPDLIQFWPAERRYRMSDGKGPGDRLQDNQKRWLAFAAAVFMLQSGSYWGEQSLAYHQARKAKEAMDDAERRAIAEAEAAEMAATADDSEVESSASASDAAAD